MPATRLTGWLALFGLMLALSLLLGCTREVVKEVLVTPVPGSTAVNGGEKLGHVAAGKCTSRVYWPA